MKHFCFCLFIAGVSIAASQPAMAVNINVTTPGSLKDLVIDTDGDFSTLTLTGILNPADVEYLTGNNGKIAQVDHLDISGISLVKSETEPYRVVTLFSEAGGGEIGRFYYSDNARVEFTSSVGGLGMPVITYYMYGTDFAGLLAKTAFRKVTLPSVPNRKVGDYILHKNSTLEEVVVPDDTESFGKCAFFNCMQLSSVNVPSSLIAIGDRAFEWTSLASFNLPSNPMTIGHSAFRISEKLTDINLENVTEIGDDAFSGTKVEIADLRNVERVGDGAFLSCPLTQLTFSEKLRSIGNQAFYSEGENRGLQVSELVLPAGLDSIGAGAFFRTKLSKVTIPETVSYIGRDAFYGTPWDQSLNTSALDGVVYLGTVAYKAVNKPQTVVFRDGTTTVSANFDTESVKSLTLPSSVRSIYGVGQYSWGNIEEANLNEGLRIIGDNVFYGARNLKSIILPSTLEYIGASAFAGSGISEVVLPESLREIGGNAGPLPMGVFGETSITSIVLPSGLEKIGEWAFSNCVKLSNVRLDSRNLVNMSYSQDKWGHNSAVFIESGIEKIIIGAGVEKLSDGIFARVGESLARVEFEDSDLPLAIGNAAIWATGAKVSGSLDRVTALGEYAFSGLEFPLGTTLDFPNLKSIGHCALDGIKGVTGLNLNYTVEYAEPEVINLCGDLRSVRFDVPDLMLERSEYGDSPLLGYAEIDSLTIGSSVQRINDGLFNGLKSNTIVFEPRHQTSSPTLRKSPVASTLSIGENVFRGNSLVYSVDFPDGLTQLGSGAFSDCGVLTNVYFHGDVAPATGSDAIPRSTTVYVPADAEQEYRSALSGNSVVPYRLESVMLDKSALSLATGGRDYLVARITPAECSEMSVVWSSSDPGVVTVSQRGDLSAVGVGKAVVTATVAFDPTFTADCIVTVSGDSGISDIIGESDSPVVEYYNLQGLKLDEPVAPGIYIVRRADGSSGKIVIK